MSVEIDIVPLGAPTTWAKVRDRWSALLESEAPFLLGPSPVLSRLGTDEEIGIDRLILPPLTAVFDIATRNTLSLTVMINRDNLSERDYIEDYGRNLTPAEIASIVDRWTRSGYSISLSSAGGRSKDEFRLLVTLALAFAEATEGVVIIMNDDAFNLGVGVYSPVQFRRCSVEGGKQGP